MNKLEEKLYERANYSCEVCGSKSGLQKHHIVKRSQGGPDTLLNLILLCWECHHGTYGIHGKHGKKLDIELKVKLQEKYFNQGETEKEVRSLMGGKLYYKNL